MVKNSYSHFTDSETGAEGGSVAPPSKAKSFNGTESSRISNPARVDHHDTP